MRGWRGLRSPYQVVLWKQESFLVLGQLTPAYSWVEYASKTKELPPDSIRTIECRLLLGTLRTSTVSRPCCASF